MITNKTFKITYVIFQLFLTLMINIICVFNVNIEILILVNLCLVGFLSHTVAKYYCKYERHIEED